MDSDFPHFFLFKYSINEFISVFGVLSQNLNVLLDHSQLLKETYEEITIHKE